MSRDVFPILVAILLVCAGCFYAYRICLGWRTGIVRVPLLQFRIEYRRKTDPLNFWVVMILTVAICAGALIFSVAFWRLS
jgi:membrane-bound acyltransferase YfiQ involved in biofilm formation